MSSFKYVTPYWRDSQDILGEGIKTYTGTTFFILNYNSVRAAIKIHFYDLEGNLNQDMEVDMLTPPNSVLDLRIVDIISSKNPNYRFSNNLKTGSMRIISDVPLVISGKMYNGRTTSASTEDLNIWSIPFEEVKVEELDLGKIGGPIPIPDNGFGQYYKRKRPGNK